jgi:hypothetical protein
LSFTIFNQPPLFNSAWQFEHHGAQRWTTLKSGDLIASRTFCSAGESARSDEMAKTAAKIDKRKIDMLSQIWRKTSNAQRPTSNLEFCRLDACVSHAGFGISLKLSFLIFELGKRGGKLATVRHRRQHPRRVRYQELTFTTKTTTVALRFRWL